jgi:hypothetical protein
VVSGREGEAEEQEEEEKEEEEAEEKEEEEKEEGRTTARCTTGSFEHQLDRLRRHETESSYITRFLREPFLDLFAAHEGLRSLLSMRKCAKELSEAYGAAKQAEALLVSLGLSGPIGEGAVLLDVCSGKGLAATLLSFLLPDAAVVMLDANGAMNLSHVRARSNLSFVQFDLFSRDAEAVLAQLGSGAGVKVCIAIGTHLVSRHVSCVWCQVAENSPVGRL